MHALITEQKGWKRDESQIHNMQYIILYTHISLTCVYTYECIYELLKLFAFRHTIESARELKEHTHACDQLEGGGGEGGSFVSWGVWCKSPLSQWVLVESRSPCARTANAARFGLSHACGVHRGIQALALCVSRLPGQSSNRSFISPTCTMSGTQFPHSLFLQMRACACAHKRPRVSERERENIYVSQSVLLSPTVSSIRTAWGRAKGGGGRSPISKSRLYFFERVEHACAQEWYASARAHRALNSLFFDGVRVREELKSGSRI